MNEDNTRLIPLTRGKFVIVDADDYGWLMQWKWHSAYSCGLWYAVRSEWNGGNPKNIQMHRQIMGVAKGVKVDHHSRDGLDNTRGNLRVATCQQNKFNTAKQKNNTSGYKGVSWHKGCGKWISHITIDGRVIHLGYFSDKNDAARAYDCAAIRHHGEFAVLNFPLDSLSQV